MTTEPEMSESILVNTTRGLLNNRPRDLTLTKISKDTGIEYRWVQDFGIRNPRRGWNVYNVERLYSYLSGKTLAL